MKTIALFVFGVISVVIGAVITQMGIVYSLLGGGVAGLGIGLMFYAVKSRRKDSN